MPVQICGTPFVFSKTFMNKMICVTRQFIVQNQMWFLNIQ